MRKNLSVLIVLWPPLVMLLLTLQTPPPRPTELWALPFIYLFPALLIKGISYRLPGSPPDPNGSAVDFIVTALGLLFVSIHVQWIYFGISGFLFFLGLGVARTKRNPWMGVRTSETLQSDAAWDRTNRRAASLLKIAGLIMLAFAFGKLFL